jgi:glycosyltransferase involved in cell wall biosynthesis
MAAGKPIVATDSPAHRRVLGNESAILVPCDPSAIAEGIITLAVDPELGRRLAASARRHALENLGWSNFLRDVDQLYTSVAGRANGE